MIQNMKDHLCFVSTLLQVLCFHNNIKACFNANYVSITILESLLLEILYYRENIKRITVKIAVVVHYESLHMIK